MDGVVQGDLLDALRPLHAVDLLLSRKPHHIHLLHLNLLQTGPAAGAVRRLRSAPTAGTRSAPAVDRVRRRVRRECAEEADMECECDVRDQIP